VRLRGHRIAGLGAPHTANSCQNWPCDTLPGVVRVNRQGQTRAQGIGGYGHALCECGWTGPHQLSGAARRRAHAQHKRSQRREAIARAA
jgi:hypothetical protein